MRNLTTLCSAAILSLGLTCAANAATDRGGAPGSTDATDRGGAPTEGTDRGGSPRGDGTDGGVLGDLLAWLGMAGSERGQN